MFKLYIGNDLGISYKWHGFGLKGQRLTLVLLLGLTAICRGFELYECLLVLLFYECARVCAIYCLIQPKCWRRLEYIWYFTVLFVWQCLLCYCFISLATDTDNLLEDKRRMERQTTDSYCSVNDRRAGTIHSQRRCIKSTAGKSNVLCKLDSRHSLVNEHTAGACLVDGVGRKNTKASFTPSASRRRMSSGDGVR